MEYVEIDCEIIHATRYAVLISDGDRQNWVPRSCIEDGNDIDLEGNMTLNMALWFAEQEEWV